MQTTQTGTQASDQMLEKTIPGGRCAVVRHVGSDDTLGEAVRYLYATWLPASGEEPRDFPLYLQRVRFFPDGAAGAFLRLKARLRARKAGTPSDPEDRTPPLSQAPASAKAVLEGSRT